jgi:hypothetical protein
MTEAVTGAVQREFDARHMPTDTNRLHPGSRIRCPHCRQWHAILLGHTEGTDYTLAMLYFECGGKRFYAGQVGLPSRHPTRETAA